MRKIIVVLFSVISLSSSPKEQPRINEKTFKKLY